MAARGGKDRDRRAAQERARAYAARLAFHDGRIRRRSRDNLVAAVGGGALILAVLAGQVAYFTLGPGAPAPEPSPTPVVTPTSTPSPSVTAEPPAETPADPSPSPTP